MKALLIPPKTGFDFVRGRQYHLVLSHLLKDREYQRFYHHQSLTGSYIILDNSAHEFTVGERASTLLRNAQLIRADEIVLPDRLFFGDDTVESTTEAMDYLLGEGLREFERLPDLSLMVVPQGRTLREYTRCLNDLVDAYVKRIAQFEEKRAWLTIGVSKDYEEWDGGLPVLLEKTVLPIARSMKARIHMLGWGRKLWDLDLIARTFGDEIRSVDSAKPFVYAMAGIKLKFPEEPIYPKRRGNFFDHEIPPGTYDLIRHNISIFDRCVTGADSWTDVQTARLVADQSSEASVHAAD